MTKKLRIIEEGNNVLVLGTSEIREAADFAGLSNAKGIFWSSSHGGLWVRRNKAWVGRSDYMPPKDAQHGVIFWAVRYPATSTKESGSNHSQGEKLDSVKAAAR